MLIGVGFFLLTFFKFDYVRKEAKISRIMSVYVLSFLYALYSLFAVATYSAISVKYLVAERRLMLSQLQISDNRPTTTATNQRRRPKFTLCALLVVTYVLLTVLPSLTRAGLYMAEVKFPYAITFWYLISIRISYTVDGVLYVLLQKKVKTWISGIWRRGPREVNGADNRGYAPSFRDTTI